MLLLISEKSNTSMTMTSDVTLEELSDELETNQRKSSSELNPELIEGLRICCKQIKMIKINKMWTKVYQHHPGWTFGIYTKGIQIQVNNSFNIHNNKSNNTSIYHTICTANTSTKIFKSDEPGSMEEEIKHMVYKPSIY